MDHHLIHILYISAAASHSESSDNLFVVELVDGTSIWLLTLTSVSINSVIYGCLVMEMCAGSQAHYLIHRSDLYLGRFFNLLIQTAEVLYYSSFIKGNDGVEMSVVF